MTLTIIVCSIFTLTGDCLGTGTMTFRDLPWSDAPCEDLVAPDYRPFLMACAKVREVAI